MSRRRVLAALLLALLPAVALAADGGTFPVESRSIEYRSGDIGVPARVFTPRGPGPFPGVLFVHGRSGLNDRLQLHAQRLAAQGFVVLAPDYHSGRFIPDNPVEHDTATEADVERGIDALLADPAVRGRQVAIVGLSRGGYHAALLGVRRPEVAAVVGYYPHLINPNAPEADQVYRYMPEVEQWRAPALLVVGQGDHQLRREIVVRVAERLRERGVEVELAVYPGAQRAFDFRTVARTLGDDLARDDAMQRTVRFIRRVLAPR
jgi:carboxymethylenebutenolidase